MSNDTMKKEYTEQDQRLAVCYSQWRRSKKSESAHIETWQQDRKVSERDIDGYVDGTLRP
jgi:hypothetical protein